MRRGSQFYKTDAYKKKCHPGKRVALLKSCN